MKRQWILFLLIGTLSMFFAEVFAGSSKVWLFDGWSLLVTYPLYLAHVVFFLNLAFKTKKTSIPHLWLWGAIFCMYESWITQVLWLGYEGTAIIEGGVLFGITLGEFFGLMLWHPLFSFILPVLVFESLALSVKSKVPLEKRVIPSHLGFLSKAKLKYLYLSFALGSVFMAMNNTGNISVITGAFLVSYIPIYLLYKFAHKDSFSIYSLKLGRKGMKITTGYLIFLYLGMFLMLGVVGKRIPGVLPIISTLVLYAFFIWAIKSAKPSKEKVVGKIKDFIHAKAFGKAAFFNVALTYAVAALYPVVKQTPLVVLYLAIMALSVILFYKAFRNRK